VPHGAAEPPESAAIPKPTRPKAAGKGPARERPFGCADCGKSFPWASHLER
ncbi:CKR1 protein, partial [Eurystomus gularis]|nr:CKR1 protein [Eurystomus gularis]